MLYLTLGEGDNANDEGIGHEFNHGKAQTLASGNLLGKVIRIDPLDHNSANRHYGIPADNPFADQHHPLGGPHEIWAYGLRSPWRTSFDPKTGDFYVADVGRTTSRESTLSRKEATTVGRSNRARVCLRPVFRIGRARVSYMPTAATARPV
jgi:glucose/arabinose dehydrogenase